MRGPTGWKSKFEKQLLYSQLGTIIEESLRNCVDCFLAGPGWQATFQDLIETEESAEKKMEIEIWAIECMIPNLLRQVDELIIRSDTQNVVNVRNLMNQLNEAKSRNVRLKQEQICTERMPATAAFGWLENIATVLGAEILLNRAKVAIAPLKSGAVGIEAESIDLADQILVIAHCLNTQAPRGNVLIARVVSVARYAKKFHEMYAAAIAGSSHHLNSKSMCIKAELWNQSLHTIGRKAAK